MEPRRRPLRTYSKRAPSTESAEPASKRRCIDDPAKPPAQDPGKRISPSDARHSAATSIPELPPPPPSLPPTKKGTITAYFGRTAPQPPVVAPSSASLTEPSSESNGPTITPPSSPPATTTRKRARRLKTRIITHRTEERAASDEDQDNEDGEQNEDGQARMGKTRDGEKSPARPAALSEIPPNALNQTKGISKEDGQYPSESRRREKKTPSAQTTLSLSMRETQFTECGECGMLYNHLHKTDVKYHARHHAALRRARMRAEDTNHATTS